MKVWISNQINASVGRRLARQWRGRPRQALEPSKLEHVLLLELGGLGDAVQTQPVLKALAHKFQGACVSVVCRDYVTGLFELLPPGAGEMTDGGGLVERVVGISKSMDGVRQATEALGNTQWDLVISTCWSTWATALALRLHAKALAGFWRPRRVECHGFEPATIPQIDGNDHLLQLRFKAVAPLGVSSPSTLPNPRIDVSDKHRETAMGMIPLTDGKFAVFVPFCSDNSKSLTDGEAQTAQQGLSGLGLPLVLVGGRAEEKALDRFVSKVNRCHDLRAKITVVSELSIAELAAVLKSARVVLSVDTGAMHLAAAVRTPTVGIFKSTNPVKCGPLGAQVLCVKARELGQMKWIETVRKWR